MSDISFPGFVVCYLMREFITLSHLEFRYKQLEDDVNSALKIIPLTTDLVNGGHIRSAQADVLVVETERQINPSRTHIQLLAQEMHYHAAKLHLLLNLFPPSYYPIDGVMEFTVLPNNPIARAF